MAPLMNCMAEQSGDGGGPGRVLGSGTKRAESSFSYNFSDRACVKNAFVH